MTAPPPPPQGKCFRCGLSGVQLTSDGWCVRCEDDDRHEDDMADGGDGYCIDCGGEGWIVTCCDDLCHGAGYCIHGDGDALCHCNADLQKSYAPDNAPRDWKAPNPLTVRKARKP